MCSFSQRLNKSVFIKIGALNFNAIVVASIGLALKSTVLLPAVQVILAVYIRIGKELNNQK
jgi:hypothetical protein